MAGIKASSKEEDVKRAMIERDAKMNPPDVEPGMDDIWGDDSWGDDSWGSSSSNNSSGDDSWGTSTGGGWGDAGGWGNTSGNSWGNTGVQQTPQSNVEDKVFEGLATGFKGVGSFMKEFVSSFKTFDSYKKYTCGIRIIFVGGGLAIVGLVILLFGKKFGLHLMVGSLLSLGFGVPLFMFGLDDFQKSGGVVPENNPSNDNAWASSEDTEFESSNFDDEEEEDFWGTSDDTDIEDEDSDEDWLDLDIDDKDDVSTSSSEALDDEDREKALEDAKNKLLNSVTEGNELVTKSYLYEKITDYLITHKPDFNKAIDLDGTRKFELLCSAVNESGEQLKTGKQEDSPYLISATEKLFYIELEIHRVKWLKNVDKFVDEIIAIYRYNEELSGVSDEDKKKTIYGLGQAVGDKIFVKIMKGETAMVTVKDTYKEVENKIVGKDYKMPIVLGIGLEGDVVVQDFWSINSILITGMPRSGKSWFAQAVLTQMMFYLSPRDLNFYIFDPKGDISDFRDMTMPHVRKFVSKEEDMLKELRHIVKVEGPRRKKLLGDAGFVNINDFKKKHPDVNLPILYIMIDEVVSLAENMDKETKDEFQSLLLVLVSQLPALGIRIIMVPHVVKDQVIKKSTTDLIPCRISVRGDEAHIESSTGTKPKDFQQKLSHQGDMAVRFNNDPTKFVHSVILTTSNEGNSDLFDFLTRLWCKICPESYKGSYAEQKQLGTCFKNMDVNVSSSKGGVATNNTQPTHTEKRQVTINTHKVLDETEIHKSLEGIHDNKDVSSYEEQEDFWDDEGW